MIYRRFWGFPSWEARSPFAELERMKRQMDRLMEGFSGTYQQPYAGVFPLINLTENKDAGWHRREREAGKFSRMIALPSEIDPNKVDAGLVNGILTVTIPKAEITKPRQIAVR